MSDMRDSASLFGPGKVFAEGREALEISRQQMADVLNLPVRTILAIEENDPTVLPDAVYVNGYMRSYAKLLGLASQPLIDAWWAQHIENDAQVSIEERNDERAEKTVNVRPFKMGRWAVAGLLLSVAFVYFVSNVNQQAASGEEEFRLAGESDVLQQDPLSQPIREAVPEPAQVVARKTVQEPTQEIESDASPLDRMEAQPSPDDAETPDVAGAEAVESAVTEPVAAKPERVQTEMAEPDTADPETVGLETAETEVAKIQVVEPALAEAETAVVVAKERAATDVVESLIDDQSAADDTLPAGEPEPEREIPLAFALPRLTEFGDNAIVLTFTADCWFEIRNEGGDLLHADLGRDTQTRRYVGDGPFQIKLGFSPGVTLVYNNEAVDLEPYTRRDVANVIVGVSAGDAEPTPQTEATQATLLW